MQWIKIKKQLPPENEILILRNPDFSIAFFVNSNDIVEWSKDKNKTVHTFVGICATVNMTEDLFWKVI